MMKKLIVAGLMAATTITAFSPVMAQEGQERWGRRGGDAQAPAAPNGEQGKHWGDRENRWREQSQPQPQPLPQTPPAPRSVIVGEPNPSAPRAQQNWQAGQNWRGDRQDNRRDWREGRQDDRRDGQEVRRDDRQNWQQNRWNDRRDDRRVDPRWSNNQWRDGHDGDRDWRDNRNWDGRNWDRDWRRDQRYDWRGYRSQYRDHYRLGRYYAPHGWGYGYRRFSVGIYLNDLLFSNNYWIDDPYRYHLPPAYGPLRWVRYYDDVLLVDIRNGYVVDVIYDFFW